MICASTACVQIDAAARCRFAGMGDKFRGSKQVVYDIAQSRADTEALQLS
ncbi:MAG: hypothetical protein ACRYGK_13655 [Janthinobacterium lividum]